MSYAERIESLVDRAEQERAGFTPPTDPPTADAAKRYLRDGAGPAIALYLEAHTSGDHHRFAPARLDALTDAMNTFLGLYARAHGVKYDPEHSIREAAELLVETENIHDVAVMLTGIPESARPGGPPSTTTGE